MPSRIAKPHCYPALLDAYPDALLLALRTRNATDGRTDGLTRDPHLLTTSISLVADARAHIRRMAVAEGVDA